MSRRPRWAAVATAVALLGAYGAVQSQSAQAASSETFADPAGDATVKLTPSGQTTGPNEPRGDVVATSATYEAGRIVMSVRTAQPVNPRDAAWGESRVVWFFDTTGDKKFDFLVDWGVDGGNMFADVFTSEADNAPALCTGAGQGATPSVQDGNYVVTINPTCFKNPAAFNWGGRTEFMQGEDAMVDRFPDGEGNYNGPIEKPGVPTTPTTPTTRRGGNPAPVPTTTTTAPAPIVAAPMSSNEGFWLLGRDGGVFSFGAAQFYGSVGNIPLNRQMVGMAAKPDGSGYWFVGADGGIFAYKAPFWGSTGSVRLTRPIVGMAATPTGKGYWLVASDGGIFSFGDAKFFGSTGAVQLNQPIVGMAPSPSGKGYWFVAADGGIFNFGDAPFFGSAVNGNPTPVVGMAATKAGTGYRVVRADGTVLAFGSAGTGGGFASGRLSAPVVAIATAF